MFRNGVLILIIGFFFTSCSEIKEEIWVNNDGSGSYSIQMEMGDMMKKMSTMMQDMDSSGAVTDNMANQKIESQDSTFTFYDPADSIYLNQLENPELIKRIVVHLHLNSEDTSMFMSTETAFTNTDELKEIYRTSEELNRLKKEATGGDENSDHELINEETINFTFGNGVFIREETDMSDLDEYDEMGLSEMEEDDGDSAEFEAIMQQMIGDFEFKSIIHFPGKIKSVSHPDYKIDGLDVVYTKPWSEILKMKKFPGVVVHYEFNNNNLDMEKYKFEILKTERPEKYFLGTKGQVLIKDIGTFYQKNLPAIFGAATQADAEINGMPSGVYFSWDEEKGEAEMMAAVPLKKPMRIEGFETITVPPSSVLATDYYGSYENLGDAHHAFDAYMAKNNLEQKSMVIEEYVTDPTTVSPEKCLTRITYFIK